MYMTFHDDGHQIDQSSPCVLAYPQSYDTAGGYGTTQGTGYGSTAAGYGSAAGYGQLSQGYGGGTAGAGQKRDASYSMGQARPHKHAVQRDVRCKYPVCM